MKIAPIDVARLDVPTRLPDLRRDIHVFVDYVCDRGVKRAHRNNDLSKADSKRLAKLMTDTEALDEIEEDGCSSWVDFVDHIALKLGFVSYDTEGEYAGYTSYAPSYPDNFIEFVEKPYTRFLAMKVAQQEATILELLVSGSLGSANEFYRTSVLGQLDGFNFRGSATGVMPTLDFPTVRRFLLGLLAKCPTGEWLSTASLIEYLKESHRYFLIPKKPRFKDKWSKKDGRYGNFHESKDTWGYEIDIAEADEDAFERVEGRYVERFLEGIPLVLRYVDVAYARKRPKAIYPSIGCLKAFRVSERLRRALSGEVPEPRITVTPNFDVYVHSEAYPAGVLSELAPLCRMVSDDTSIVLKLEKQNVAAARAANPKLDVVALLRRLSGGELPANVARELSDWSQHGEKFVLYSNCSLLEGDKDLPAADSFTVERVAPTIRVIHSPDKLFAELEKQELVPLRVKHSDQALAKLPKGARTCFPKKGGRKAKQRAPKTQVTLMRVTRVQLLCPDREFLDELQRILFDNECPIETDRKKLTLAYSKRHESEVSNAIRTLKKNYKVKIEDAG
ncbi:MAG: hypothetical protein ISR77_05155 [Pirellulaceae bacterium]|nr:hypothetical protein [Pirellulaceae bacterium]